MWRAFGAESIVWRGQEAIGCKGANTTVLSWFALTECTALFQPKGEEAVAPLYCYELGKFSRRRTASCICRDSAVGSIGKRNPMVCELAEIRFAVAGNSRLTYSYELK
jgi:hypothetical protein